MRRKIKELTPKVAFIKDILTQKFKFGEIWEGGRKNF